MAELLLELASEEIPARMQARAAADLKRLVTEKLTTEKIAHAEAAAFATPRRLALVVKGLPQRQSDKAVERKGPKVGAPEQAVQGFLKAAGLASLDQAEIRETDKGQVYVAVRKVAGRATAEVLPELLVQAIQALSWPKSMRWGTNTFRWVRPLRNILVIFNGEPLSGQIVLGRGTAYQTLSGMTSPSEFPFDVPLDFSSVTEGHYMLDSEVIRPQSFSDYRTQLERHFVILDPEKRKRSILEQAEDLAAGAHLHFRHDDGLLDEVAGLVEWPLVLMGSFEEDFLSVPPEILVTSMRTHQKYFALENPDGGLANRFLLVANVEAPDGSPRRANIVAGNERVLRARLSDARFFWDQDRRTRLSDRVPALKDIVFHARLGTLDQRVDRIEALAVALTQYVKGADREQVRAAARLCKADLVSGVVGEFPELQGIMGRYYALADGEPPAVADAIAEHYAPKGPDDACPTAPVSVCVALAEKLDTLVGFWAIDEKPTGSKDPFALRRAALGAIRLILENKLRLPLREAFAAGAQALGATGAGFKPDELLAFFADRLKVALREQGVRHDLVAAVFALGGENDLVRLLARVEALSEFLATEDGANLLVAYRRAANIVRIEAKKDGKAVAGAPDPHAFVQHEEQALWQALQGAEAVVKVTLGREDFRGAMKALAALRHPVDAFFDKILVNAEERGLRANRLRLLQAIQATMDRVAVFAQVEG